MNSDSSLDFLLGILLGAFFGLLALAGGMAAAMGLYQLVRAIT